MTKKKVVPVDTGANLVTTVSKREKVGTFVKRNAGNFLAMLLMFGLGFLVTMNGGIAMASLEIEGLTDIKGLVTSIAGVLGFLVATYGAISFGLGLSQDNPDAQSRGLKMLIGGVVIAGASVLAGTSSTSGILTLKGK